MNAAPFHLAALGRVHATEEFRVNSVRLAQYAAAVDDTTSERGAGRVATPVFHAIPPTQATMEALAGVVATPFILHGEHDLHIHQPIRPGMRLLARACAVGIRQTPAGVAVVVKSTTETDGGDPVDEQYLTGLLAGRRVDADRGEGAPDHRVPPEATRSTPVASATYPMTADQTRRYADASRDYSAYTLDRDAARVVGFGNLLVHGLLTLAYAARAVLAGVCGDDAGKLRRLACRFAGPVLLVPDQTITTRTWRLGTRDGRSVYAYESADASGAVVIRHGIAEVAP